MAMITGALSGCGSDNSETTSTIQNTDVILVDNNDDADASASIRNSTTWSQNPEWISRNYDLNGRPKIAKRVYYDYFRFRRQKAERELAARQATDSMLYQYAHQRNAEDVPDTVVEVQRTFTGYRPDTVGDTLQ
ncbi:MAG: hypothetical protein K0Q79_458 [Flavipsychrobacter sp.]|jgi:hypothetical protein|nr:hypothetical protein [Flavipsychrobacter sp.]